MTKGTRALCVVEHLAEELGYRLRDRPVGASYITARDGRSQTAPGQIERLGSKVFGVEAKLDRLEIGLSELTRKVNALADAFGIYFEDIGAQPPRTVARFILKEKGATDGPTRKKATRDV